MAATKREEQKLEKQLDKLQYPLTGVRRKNSGRFDEQRTQSVKETRLVRLLPGARIGRATAVSTPISRNRTCPGTANQDLSSLPRTCRSMSRAVSFASSNNSSGSSPVSSRPSRITRSFLLLCSYQPKPRQPSISNSEVPETPFP